MLAATVSYPDFQNGVASSPSLVLASARIGDHPAAKTLVNESITQIRENPELAYELLCTSFVKLINHPDNNDKPSDTLKQIESLVSRSIGVMEKYQQSNLRV